MKTSTTLKIELNVFEIKSAIERFNADMVIEGSNYIQEKISEAFRVANPRDLVITIEDFSNNTCPFLNFDENWNEEMIKEMIINHWNVIVPSGMCSKIEDAADGQIIVYRDEEMMEHMFSVNFEELG
jgi:hypothetical protein